MLAYPEAEVITEEGSVLFGLLDRAINLCNRPYMENITDLESLENLTGELCELAKTCKNEYFRIQAQQGMFTLINFVNVIKRIINKASQ